MTRWTRRKPPQRLPSQPLEDVSANGKHEGQFPTRLRAFTPAFWTAEHISGDVVPGVAAAAQLCNSYIK